MISLKKILLLVFLFLLSGCGNSKYIVCSADIKNNVENYNLVSKYKIYYDKNFATKIYKNEVYKSNDENIIDYFEEYKKLDYSNLNDLYGGYDYEIIRDKNSVTVNVTVNLSDVDLKKMVDDGEIDKNYVIAQKITVSGLKKIYEEKGYECYE